VPILVDYGAGCRWSAEELITRILKLADRDPAKLIGIITPNNQCRERWYQALRQPRPDLHLDHGPPRVLTYASGHEGGNVRFSEGGLFVINAQSAKGLEFDTVFLADIHAYPCQFENQAWMDDLRRRFYVMVSRAREQVILLRQAGQECPVAAILPNDADILRRWR
jgi:superfamily I DNA/RNA helicase